MPSMCFRLSSFNPRTHTGCDRVSTYRLESQRLFQSTHPHGVRLGFNLTLIIGIICFNPRTHTGCDPKVCPTWSRCARFNPRTHTGCDVQGQKTAIGILGFNPRTHTGCDLCRTILTINHRLFQSTHPHGVRRVLSALFQSVRCFNPRTHTGCDKTKYKDKAQQKVSIHAPTRGATT